MTSHTMSGSTSQPLWATSNSMDFDPGGWHRIPSVRR
jgi:hypothetical protein